MKEAEKVTVSENYVLSGKGENGIIYTMFCECFNYNDYEGIKDFEKNIETGAGITYAMEIGDKVKIGSTSQPHQRMKTLVKNFSAFAAAKNEEISFGAIVLSLPCFNFRKNELELHKMFAEKRIEGTELFEITIEEVILAMENKLDYIGYKENDLDKREQDKAFLKTLIAPIQNAINATDTIIYALAEKLVETHEKLLAAEEKIKIYEEACKVKLDN